MIGHVPSHPPILDYAPPEDRRIIRRSRWLRVGLTASALAAFCLLGTFASLAFDYHEWGHRFPVWRWYDNDAVALFSWAGGLLGLSGLVATAIGWRSPHPSLRRWMIAAIIADSAAILCSPVSAILHAR